MYTLFFPNDLIGIVTPNNAVIDQQPMDTLITIQSVSSTNSPQCRSHYALRQYLIVLLRKINHFNLNAAHPSLTAIQLLSVQILLVLHHADHTPTFDDLMNQLHVSGTALHASLDDLQHEQAIILHRLAKSTQIHRIEITLEGRIRAQPLSSWTDLLIRFVDHATPTVLNELHHGLLASLSRRRNTIDISALCLTCRYFTPFRYPHDPIQPHHCHLIEKPMLDRQLRTSCQEQPISTHT